MKIYVASSWRNGFQPGVVASLRAEGYRVYDFKGVTLTVGGQMAKVRARIWLVRNR